MHTGLDTNDSRVLTIKTFEDYQSQGLDQLKARVLSLCLNLGNTQNIYLRLQKNKGNRFKKPSISALIYEEQVSDRTKAEINSCKAELDNFLQQKEFQKIDREAETQRLNTLENDILLLLATH